MRKIKFPLPFIEFEGFNPEGDKVLTVSKETAGRRDAQFETNTVFQLVDLRMIELSYFLRCKPLWWTRIKDPAIRSQWKAEALQRKVRGAVLRDAEIEYVLDELEDYTFMKNVSNGIQVSSFLVRQWEAF